MAIAFDANLGTVKESATLTTTAAAAAGSRVLLFGFYFDGGGATCNGGSGGGLTWVADDNYVNASGNTLFVASADAPSGLASSTVITPSFTSAVDFGPGLAAVSFTGMATGASGYVDVVATDKENTSNPWTTNNVVTTDADTLLIGLAMSDAASSVATAPYTEIHDWNSEGSNRTTSVYRIVASAGTYTPGGSWAAGPSFGIFIGIAYKQGGPPVGAVITEPSYARFPKPKMVVPAAAPIGARVG